jgi:cysteinyl-tRNA synthetase
MLKVYNTLKNQVEAFIPLSGQQIGLYTCGPTVYDYAHIGNFRSYLAEDLIKRYMTYRGYGVTHVMNITDIDDKTIRKAMAAGIPLSAVTEPFIESFFADLEALNVCKADHYPRATAFIPEMLEIIARLEEKGHAYRRDGSVYFRISSFPEYGRLANVSADQLKMGTSVDADEYEKENVQDFVLWKGYRAGEPFWDSPFGPGRPGWHIECSAMSAKYLGETFDVHMGGVDNIFPHHENEIAQSQCANNKPFVKYWLHCQHLIVDGQKMSKSLGNFYTVKDILGRGVDPMALRYLLITTHYRKLLNFSFAGLEQAAQSLRRIRDFMFTLDTHQPQAGAMDNARDLIEAARQQFVSAMDDDFNISGGLAALFDLISAAHKRMPDLGAEGIEALRKAIREFDTVLGVLPVPKEPQSLDAEIEEQIRLRQEARQAKDFKKADIIRDELKVRGIILIDTPGGVTWKRE